MFAQDFNQGPLMSSFGAIRSKYGMLLPPGARVVYLRSTATSNNDPPELVDVPPCTTLAQALLQCRAGYGDIILALPGHTENVTTTPTWVAGVKLIGVGHGSNRPTFRWTATTSQWAIAAADVCISGLRLRLEGANGVVKAIVVTAADFLLENCDVEMASGATAKATIGIEMGTGAARFRIAGCRFRGTATHNVTDGIKIVGVVDGGIIESCTGVFSATAANGLIHVTAAATNLIFRDLDLYNTHTSSTATIAFDDTACDGVCSRITSAVMNNGTASSQGLTFGTAATIQCNQCFNCDEPKKSGILNPAAAT